MTTVQLPPFDLRTVYPWMQPDAVFAAHFKQGQYWLDDAKGPIAASSLLTTTRSSSINLPNVAGVFQTHGNNTLPRTDRGLYANGQIAALNANGNNPQSATGWVSINSTAADGGSNRGIFNSAIVTATVSASGAYRRTASLNLAEGQTVAVKVAFSADCPDPSGEAVMRVNNVDASSNLYWRGPLGNLQPDASPPADGIVTLVHQDAENFHFLYTAVSAGQRLFGVGPNVLNKQVRLDGIDVTDTTFVPVAWVSTDSPAPPLMASDIRAVQGTRPSNLQPEPFPGWEAAGLDDAVAGKAVVNIDRLNASATRFIAGAGVDADNLWRLIFDTDNRFKLVVRKSGVDEVSLQTGAVAATGDKTIEWQAKPGDYAIAATGVAGDTDSDGATLPAGATTLRIGSNFGALTPFNGWISEIQIARAV